MTAEHLTFSAAELALKAVDHNPRHSFGTETPDIFKDDEIIENHSVRPSSSLATAFVTAFIPFGNVIDTCIVDSLVVSKSKVSLHCNSLYHVPYFTSKLI